MTPADAMLYMVIAASIAILVYVKFGKRDSRGQEGDKIKGTLIYYPIKKLAGEKINDPLIS